MPFFSLNFNRLTRRKKAVNRLKSNTRVERNDDGVTTNNEEEQEQEQEEQEDNIDAKEGGEGETTEGKLATESNTDSDVAMEENEENESPKEAPSSR